jgi:hypothetical protein
VALQRGSDAATTLAVEADQQQLFNLLSPPFNEYSRAQELEGLWKESESECCILI